MAAKKDQIKQKDEPRQSETEKKHNQCYKHVGGGGKNKQKYQLGYKDHGKERSEWRQTWTKTKMKTNMN